MREMELQPTKIELLWDDQGCEDSTSDSSSYDQLDGSTMEHAQSPEFGEGFSSATGTGLSIRQNQMRVFAYDNEGTPFPTLDSLRSSSSTVQELRILPLPFKEFLPIEKIFFILNDQREQVRSLIHHRIPHGLKDNCFLLVDNSENMRRQRENARLVFGDDRGAWKNTNRNSSHYLIRKQKLTLVHPRDDGYCLRRRERGQFSYIPILPTPPENLVIKVGKYYGSQGDYQRRITWIESDVVPSPRAVVEYKGTFSGHQPHGNCKRKSNVYFGKACKRAPASEVQLPTMVTKKSENRVGTVRPIEVRSEVSGIPMSCFNKRQEPQSANQENLSHTKHSGEAKPPTPPRPDPEEKLKNVYLTVHTDEKVLSTRTFRVPEILITALCRSAERESSEAKRASAVPFQIFEKYAEPDN